VGEVHVIGAFVLEHRTAGLALVLILDGNDEPVAARPVDAVLGGSHLDLVERFLAAVEIEPGNAGEVEHMPLAVEEVYPRAANDERLKAFRAHDRAFGILLEGLAPILADREP